jgi:hypothetical protein
MEGAVSLIKVLVDVAALRRIGFLTADGGGARQWGGFLAEEFFEQKCSTDIVTCASKSKDDPRTEWDVLFPGRSFYTE